MRVFLQGRFTATFINAEKPDEMVVIDIPAHALDSGDKAPGKAMSMAKKYALLHMFLLETGEEEESRAQEVDELKMETALAQLVAHLKSGKPEQALAVIDSGDLTIAEKIKLNGWLTSVQKKELREARQAIALAKINEGEPKNAV